MFNKNIATSRKRTKIIKNINLKDLKSEQLIKTVNQFENDVRLFVNDNFNRFQSTENFIFFSLSSFQQIFNDLNQSSHTFGWTFINQQLTLSTFVLRYFNLNSIWIEKFKISKKSLSKSFQFDQISISSKIDALS